MQRRSARAGCEGGKEEVDGLCEEGSQGESFRRGLLHMIDLASQTNLRRIKRSQVRKRKKKVIDEDDMDGEEKLRLGLEVKNKKRKSKVSGKWFSDIYGV